MKVINLLGDNFEKACFRLAEKINADYEPDIIVGVLTGGGIVGKNVYNAFNLLSGRKPGEIIYSEIRVQRGSTDIKRKLNIRKLFMAFPEFLLNILRNAEYVIRNIESVFKVPKRTGDFFFDNNVDAFLKSGPKNILVVDDSMDTGATLKAINDFIIKKYGRVNKIKFAVINVSHVKTLIDVDYTLYKRVLIRYPWAYDAKR